MLEAEAVGVCAECPGNPWRPGHLVVVTSEHLRARDGEAEDIDDQADDQKKSFCIHALGFGRAFDDDVWDPVKSFGWGGDVRFEAQIDAVGRCALEDETDSRLTGDFIRVGELINFSKGDLSTGTMLKTIYNRERLTPMNESLMSELSLLLPLPGQAGPILRLCSCLLRIACRLFRACLLKTQVFEFISCH